MASVTVLRNFGPLTDLALVTVEDWAAIGRVARERIIRRTQAGTDESDQAFAPYSPAYLAAKKAAGGSSRVDLTLSGEMLQNIAVEPDAHGVTLAYTR